MPLLKSEPLLILGERSTLDRFNYRDLPTHTRHTVDDASELAELELQFSTLEHRQIFLAMGRNDARRGTPFQKYERQIERFIEHLRRLYADQKFLNVCYIRPRYHKHGIVEEEKNQARYISITYSMLLNAYPQTIMFTQDGRDPWVSKVYKSLFFNMHKHPVIKAVQQAVEHVPSSSRSRTRSSSSSTSSSTTDVQDLPPAPAPRKHTLRMYVYCKDLPNRGAGTVDPYVKIDDGSQVVIKSQRTKTRSNTVNPVFKEMLEVEYTQATDLITFQVKDDDIGANDVLGTVTCAVLGLTEGEHKNLWGYQCHELDKGGFLYIQAFTEFEYSDTLEFDIEAKDLPKMDGMFGKTDAYFEITLPDDHDNFMTIYTSPVQKSTLNPNWGRISLPIHRFGIRGIAAGFLMRLYDHDDIGKNDYIGVTRLNSFAEMINSAPPHILKIWNAEKKGSDAKRGEIHINNIHYQRTVQSDD